MGMKWSTLVLLLVLQSSYLRCEGQTADDSIKDVPTWSSLPTGGANDGSSNRRRPLIDPEHHEHSGIDAAQPSEGVYFDTADWSKEAEKWMFKGGDWGLVTLPDDNHPDIADPPVPGPMLLAEGNSMKKVIVSRSLTGLENVSLHFSYFLTSNPKNPPELKVFQLQGKINSLVWPNDANNDNVGYGQWNHGKVDMLPFNGDFEIKFIGQRVVDTNDIGLDDIVLRGTYIKNTVGDGILRAEDNANYTTTLIPQNENNVESNNTHVEITTVSNEDDNINVTMGKNSSVSENEDEVANNSSMVTENPQVSNDAGTNVPDNVYNQSYASVPESFSSNEAPNNDTDTVPNTTVPSDNFTTLDRVQNTTAHVVNITTVTHDNLTVLSNISTDTPFNNVTVVDNSTDIIQNNSSSPLSQNITSLSPYFNTTTLQPQSQTAPIQNVTNPSLNISTPLFNITTPIQNNTNPSLSVSTPLFNITTPIQNNTNPSLNISTPLFNITSNASIFVTGPGGIEGTDSPPVQDASWGVFKIFLTITVLGGIVLFFLYWRKRRLQDDEIPVFSRGSHADYHNPTFQDDGSADEGLAGRGSPFNYKSFS